jgi:hypothetical protein
MCQVGVRRLTDYSTNDNLDVGLIVEIILCNIAVMRDDEDNTGVSSF